MKSRNRREAYKNRKSQRGEVVTQQQKQQPRVNQQTEPPLQEFRPDYLQQPPLQPEAAFYGVEQTTQWAAMPSEAVFYDVGQQQEAPIIVNPYANLQEEAVARQYALPQEEVVASQYALPQEEVVASQYALPQEEAVASQYVQPQEKVVASYNQAAVSDWQNYNPQPENTETTFLKLVEPVADNIAEQAADNQNVSYAAEPPKLTPRWVSLNREQNMEKELLQQNSPMKVALLAYTPEPEKVVAAAARLCYSPKSGIELLENFTDEKVENFLTRLSTLGHFSPFEHATFTFAVDGVSRSLSHQLVRHRIASYSQKSQRYVDETGFHYIVPPSIAADQTLDQAFHSLMQRIERFYEELVSVGVPPEDARAILPNAATTNLVITMNARSLHNFFRLRCCHRAQTEIRQLANLMLAKVKRVAPHLFAAAGAACLTEGVCPEGEMSCGLLEKINKDK